MVAALPPRWSRRVNTASSGESLGTGRYPNSRAVWLPEAVLFRCACWVLGARGLATEKDSELGLGLGLIAEEEQTAGRVKNRVVTSCLKREGSLSRGLALLVCTMHQYVHGQHGV